MRWTPASKGNKNIIYFYLTSQYYKLKKLFLSLLSVWKKGEEIKPSGFVWESNPGPLAPELCVLPMRHTTSTIEFSKSLKRKKRSETFYNTMGPLPRSLGKTSSIPWIFKPCASKGKISSSTKKNTFSNTTELIIVDHKTSFVYHNCICYLIHLICLQI